MNRSDAVGKEDLINSIVRAVDVLELFDRHNIELGVSEIARQLNLYKSTAYRILSTLEYKGILEKNKSNGKYRLGLKLYKLGILAREGNELIAISLPHLKRLTERTGETSNLVVMDGCMSVYLAQHESTRMVRMFTRVGAKVYPHCNGAGKVLLSYMTREEIDCILSKNGMPAYTKNTITTRKQLMEEIETIRMRGYAVDNQEREDGVMCIACPVMDKFGKAIAAISISGPRDRFQQGRMEVLIQAVKEEARAISRELGFADTERGERKNGKED